MKEQPAQPKTMLKKEYWGLLTINALLSTFVFPPYFIYLMSVAALTEFAHLWTTHLSEVDQKRFIEFEREFRKGYKLEKAGRFSEALGWYQRLKKIHADHPQANHLITLQIEKLSVKPGKRSKGSQASSGKKVGD